MPYEWSASRESGKTVRRLRLWPHRSLPRKGFATVILGAFAMIILPLFPLLGTVFVWELLPFLLMALAGLWWGLQRSYRDAQLSEELRIDPDEVHLRRIPPRGQVREWRCQSHWSKVQIHRSGGPVADYVTLRGCGREVEIGAFLSQDERKALFRDLSEALEDARRPVPPD